MFQIMHSNEDPSEKGFTFKRNSVVTTYTKREACDANDETCPALYSIAALSVCKENILGGTEMTTLAA